MTMEYNRVAFGSCNNQNLTNPLWDVLTTRNPDAFIWAGDAIYADINIGNDWSTFPPKSIHQSATPSSFITNYNKQKYNKSYQNFIQTTNVTVLGTVDDHDYGMNNGDLTFKYKIESGVSFLDFVDEEKDSLMYVRAKKGFGVYGVKVFDFSKDDGQYLLSDEEAGLDYDLHSDENSDDENLDENPDENDIDIGQQQYEPKRVAIFLLDARTNKTPWGEGLKGWKPNYDGDFLGERQWEWFEKSIQKSNASVNIIVNGLQVHSYRHPNSNSAELWSHFPKSRQRLYDAILQDGVKAPIIVSGDVHMAQFLRKDCVKTKTINANFVNEDEAKIRPLVEFTSSGMTHSWGSCFASTERFHTTWRYYPFHFLSTTMMTLAHFIFPMPDLMVSEKSNVHVQKNSNGVNENIIENANANLYENGGAENAKKGQQYSIEKNFGEFEFDWKARVVRVRAIGQDVNAPPLLSASYSFDQLSGNKVMPGNIADRETSMKKGKYLMDGNVVEGEFICMNHRPAASLFHVVSGFLGLTSYLAIILLGPQILVLLLIRKMLIKQTRKKSN